MKRKYRIKKKAENEYSVLTGNEAFKMAGGSGCLIVKSAFHLSRPMARYAYKLYSEDYDLNRNVEVSNSCGVLNCVLKDHLEAVYKPSKVDRDYIDTYLKVDGAEVLAKNLNIPIHLFHRFINSLDK